MDKEKLIKNHFWILLGLALVLIPIVLLSVWMGVAAATEKKREEITQRQKALQSSQPKAQGYVNAMEEQKKELEKRKITDWKAAYEAQKGLIEWPNRLAHLNRLYFGDPITDEDRNSFRKADVYLPEFESLAELVKPTELAGGWQQVLRNVKWGERFPSPEDAWLALEDICIQREMMRSIHAVNQLLAEFVDVTNKEGVLKELNDTLKPAEGENVQRFISPYWQLDLAISKSTQGKGGEMVARGKITNVSHRRLNIARIDFLLTMIDPKVTQSRPAVLPIEGDYLAVGNSIPFKDKRLATSAPKPFVYSVEQKLDPRYVPVKRLDKVVLGYHSHRTVDKPLVMCKMSEEAKKAAGTETAPPPDQPPAAGGATATPAEKSISGIDRLRYVTVTDQVRRMPIGVVVTVDQAHVQDVLRAFANSRLRFQTTQMHLTHATSNSGSAGSTVGMPMPAMPAVPAMPLGGEQRPGGRPVPGGMPNIGGQPAMQTAPAASAEETNANLVEMSIYGIASIYEKFPPKPKPGEEPIQVPATTPTTTPASEATAPPPAPTTPAPPPEKEAPKESPKDAPKDAPKDTPKPNPPM